MDERKLNVSFQYQEKDCGQEGFTVLMETRLLQGGQIFPLISAVSLSYFQRVVLGLLLVMGLVLVRRGTGLVRKSWKTIVCIIT